MKKIQRCGVLLLAWCAAAAFGQDEERSFKISSFARSGVVWESAQTQGEDSVEKVRMGSLDDAGDGDGRWRLEMEYAQRNMGIKTRIQWDNWINTTPQWIYAFAYGNFLDDQLTFSIGKLGGSPWGSGGPEMWKELEISGNGGGVRAEYKPFFAPGLNVGFVLNSFNEPQDRGWPEDKMLTLVEILKESVLGVAYEHPDWGLARFAVRFDGEYDRNRGQQTEKSTGEEEILYRVEEKIIANYLPGFKVWALGYGMGLGNKDVLKVENWLFTEYNPEMFTAQIRFGFDYTPTRSVLHVKPSFYWKFFDNLLNVGAAFWYGQDFGLKKYEGSPYSYIEAEPKIQLNFGANYVAFTYAFRQEYGGEFEELDGTIIGPLKQIHRMNLRFSLQL